MIYNDSEFALSVTMVAYGTILIRKAILIICVLNLNPSCAKGGGDYPLPQRIFKFNSS